MSFGKLTDNLLKVFDRYVYGPVGRVFNSRAIDSFMMAITSDKFVKLVWIPSFVGLVALFVWAIAAAAQYEKENPCLEWVETGKQTCSTFCTNTGKHMPPICSTSCRPEEVCVVRQMADGTIQER